MDIKFKSNSTLSYIKYTALRIKTGLFGFCHFLYSVNKFKLLILQLKINTEIEFWTIRIVNLLEALGFVQFRNEHNEWQEFRKQQAISLRRFKASMTEKSFSCVFTVFLYNVLMLSVFSYYSNGSNFANAVLNLMNPLGWSMERIWDKTVYAVYAFLI